MSERPIGVFDSGLGGLTAVKELLNVLPCEDIVYFGDTGRVPYGNRSKETIIKYAKQDANFLLSKDVKYIVAACGTVSSVACEISTQIPVPFTGVVRPTAEAAVERTKNGKIGVIGTSATIRSSSYKKEIELLDRGIVVYQCDCPLFVPLVENGFTSEDDPVVVMIVQRYLEKFIQLGVDTIILGCTHYPILKKAISKVMGSGVRLVDSGRETALYTASMLKSEGLLCKNTHSGTSSFYVSDTPDGFSHLAGMFLDRNIDDRVEQIDIEKY